MVLERAKELVDMEGGKRLYIIQFDFESKASRKTIHIVSEDEEYYLCKADIDSVGFSDVLKKSDEYAVLKFLINDKLVYRAFGQDENILDYVLSKAKWLDLQNTRKYDNLKQTLYKKCKKYEKEHDGFLSIIKK